MTLFYNHPISGALWQSVRLLDSGWTPSDIVHVFDAVLSVCPKKPISISSNLCNLQGYSTELFDIVRLWHNSYQEHYENTITFEKVHEKTSVKKKR